MVPFALRLHARPSRHGTITQGLITAFADSLSFEEAGRRAKTILAKNGTLTIDELNHIVDVSSKNSQIVHGFEARAAIQKLINGHPKIDTKNVKRFRQATGEIELD